jgi:hypothetical protein
MQFNPFKHKSNLNYVQGETKFVHKLSVAWIVVKEKVENVICHFPLLKQVVHIVTIFALKHLY